MNNALVKNQGDVLFYGLGLATLVCSITAALSQNILPMLIPVFLIAAYFVIVDFKLLYFLLIGLLAVSTEVEIPGGLSTDLPGEPIMWLMTIGYLALCLVYPKSIRIPIKNPITLLLLLHVIWILFAAFMAERNGVAFKFFVAKVWYVIPFFFVPFVYLLDEKNIKKCLYILFTISFVAVCYVILKHSTMGFRYDTIEKAVQPIYRNHVNYACLLVIILPYAWGAFRWNKRGTFAFWFIIALNVIIPLGIYLSFTRAAIGSMIIGAAAYFILRFKLTKLAIVVSIIGAIIGLTNLVKNNTFMEFAPNYEQTISQHDFNNLIEATAKGEDISSMERVYRWVAGFRMVSNKPITGFGPNNFYPTYKRYTISSFETYVSDNPEHSGIHNYYLMTAVEQGIPGLIIFLAFCIVTLLFAERHYHRIKDVFYKNMVAAAYMSFIIIMSILIVNDLLEADKVGPFFFLAAAFMAMSKYWVKKEQIEMQNN
ncbi:O-antigen ligase family protein [Saprospiraceae bacterium]|nr:O-antigen ligase family protein [Saprospiraceae bacterium]